LKKETVLLSIFRQRQSFNEIRTIRAVEECRRLIFEKIETFFEQRERTITSLLPKLISSRKSYSYVFNNNELDEIYDKTETIIKDELFKRFNRLVVWQVKKTNTDDWIFGILNSIQNYHKTKKRTVLVTSYMEKISRRTLGHSINLFMGNSLPAQLACNIDISTILLPQLGINSELETMELQDELLNRIGGALCSIKYGLVQELNHQIANLFYETHDIINRLYY
jgi:hypothetical protein